MLIAWLHSERGRFPSLSIALAIVVIVRLNRSAILLDSWEYGGLISWMIPSNWKNSHSSLLTYSPPPSVLNRRFVVCTWIFCSLTKSMIRFTASDFSRRKRTQVKRVLSSIRLRCHAGDDWWPPGSIRGHRGGCQRVIGGHWVSLEDTAGLPGCRASAAGWRNLSTQSGGPQSEQCD